MYRCSSHDGTFEAVILCTYGNGHIGTAAQRYEALQSPPVFERSGDGDDSASEGSSISVRSVIADVKPKRRHFVGPFLGLRRTIASILEKLGHIIPSCGQVCRSWWPRCSPFASKKEQWLWGGMREICSQDGCPLLVLSMMSAWHSSQISG